MVDDIVARVVGTYRRMSIDEATVTEQARERLAAYVSMLSDGGQSNPDRLTVLGLTFLRELDGTNDPVSNGYTGM